MQSTALTPDAYVAELEPDRKEAIERLRSIFNTKLTALGFEETMGSGMINYVVPYSLYPPGYHCKPKQPLPFLGLAAQKNFIAVYHLGIYSDEAILKWFEENYPKHTSAKLDMGKSCIRFKKEKDIPYALFEALAEKISAEKWIATYELGRQQGKRGV